MVCVWFNWWSRLLIIGYGFGFGGKLRCWCLDWNNCISSNVNNRIVIKICISDFYIEVVFDDVMIDWSLFCLVIDW